VAEPNGALEQLLLPFLWKLAPQIERGFAQDLREALRTVVLGHAALRGFTPNPKRQLGSAGSSLVWVDRGFDAIRP
jgi:hypothetical protein